MRLPCSLAPSLSRSVMFTGIIQGIGKVVKYDGKRPPHDRRAAPHDRRPAPLCGGSAEALVADGGSIKLPADAGFVASMDPGLTAGRDDASMRIWLKDPVPC